MTNLKMMRQFFMAYQHRIGQKPSDLLTEVRISQQPSAKLLPAEIGQKAADALTASRTASGELALPAISATPSRKSPLPLSWSHYVLLLGLKDPGEQHAANAGTPR